ncbi:MAG TPA: ExeM/NucH family extracellular endonuclease, partial [Anaerolineaceae bacterium]|nr:ExeM/NucH family extracellular endonuclease [Anaerolineaceae bacterium]
DPVYTLNPDADFTGGESCTVTIDHEKVTDDDLIDPPDNMENDYTFTFTVALGCGDAYTPIPAIQGDGMVTPLSGQTVSTEGVVVADYQTNAYVSGTRNGFFMQSVTPDDDPNTSEGLFIYSYLLDVAVGDHVRVTGKATEYNGLTELSPVSQIQVCGTGNSISPTEFTLPADSLLDFERLEGMLVTIPQELVISEYYNFDRYGEIVLATQRFMTYTAANEPSVVGFAAWLDNLKLNSITLDDGRESQNPDPAIHPNGLEFTLENRFRGGDLVSDVTGVMDYEFSKYRIQPTQGANYTEANPRPEAAELAPGFLKVASFNVLNYFTTIDLGTGHWICGPSGDMECRGADTAEELTRQRAKILAALSGINADIFGIMEIENDKPLGEGESPDYAVADLVAGLNAEFGEGTFAYIATGAIGTDAIKQAIIYKPAAVTPVGEFQLLTTAVDPRFIDTLNRPVLAQVFEDNFTGETFVVAVNHLKSKGSTCTGDPDLLDGQGNCNLTRKAAAEALVDWLANPTYFPDVENALIIGDLNSYDHEDPIDMIKLGADDMEDTDDDYLDMIAEIHGENAYGYVYDAQIGYLDYALANTSLAERIVDVNFWHINADEPDILDYDMTFKQDAQDALYAPDAYRSSDHDPVIVTISFNAAPVAEDMEVSTDEDTAVDITLDVSDANDDPLTAEIVTGPEHGELTLNDLVATYTPDINYNGPDSFTYKVSDGELDSNTATVSITVTPVNDAPVANDMTETTAEDTPKVITVNASDIDGDTLTAEIMTGPANGSVSVNGLEVTYTPSENWYGEDIFTYRVSDGEANSNIATVTITVTPVNDAPVAESFEVDLQENGSMMFTLLASDVDGDTLTFSIISEPAHGILECTGVNCTYTPNLHWFGTDSFIFKANDGLLDSNEATVTLNVIPLPRIYLPIIFR